MKIKYLVLSVVLLIIAYSCNDDFSPSDEYFDTKKDTAFYMNNLNDTAQGLVLSLEFAPYKNIIIDNRIIISIYFYAHKHYFVIKELGKDSIRHFFYSYEKVPSISYGIRYDKKNVDMKILSDIYMRKENPYTADFSNSFYNIHEQRSKSKVYQKYFVKYNLKIEDIEDIVNKMEIFKEFSVKNQRQMNVLKKFLFYTRIASLGHGNWRRLETMTESFNYSIIEQINSEKEINKIKQHINNMKFNKDILWEYWKSRNYQYLMDNMQAIKGKLNEPSTFAFFFPKTDAKLFIYRVYKENGRIRIEEDYFNKDYMWYHPYTGLAFERGCY